jgi:hypothetical protein
MPEDDAVTSLTGKLAALDLTTGEQQVLATILERAARADDEVEGFKDSLNFAVGFRADVLLPRVGAAAGPQHIYAQGGINAEDNWD